MFYPNITQNCVSSFTTTILLLLSTVTLVTWSADMDIITLLGRGDVMGNYSLSNQEQCRRLCWYRRLCASYGFKQDRRRGINCLLLADPLSAEPLPNRWSVKTATPDALDSTCASRPCSETEVCVHAGNTLNEPSCLPLPADCGEPEAVANGSWNVTGTLQGQAATLTCNPPFRLTAASPTRVMCAVTSQWTPSVGDCLLMCENGGTPDGDRCLCPIQYAGVLCGRLIRDCKEAFNNGGVTAEQNGPYSIQPLGAPHSFRVLCLFEWGGATVPFRRKYQTWSNLDWAAARAGRVGDLETAQDPWDFWAGLDNVHYLSDQAHYQVHVSLWGGPGGAGVFYHNLTIGSESTLFALSYDGSNPSNPNPADDGFKASNPLPFSSQDRDEYGCAGTRGAPGWYGQDCSQFSLFALDLQWAVDGTTYSFFALDFVWSRQSAFSDGVQ